MTSRPTRARSNKVSAATKAARARKAFAVAVDGLRDTLAAAADDANWSNDGGRASAIAALEAIFAFTEEVDELRELKLAPLIVLHLALCNLDRGHVPLTLEPSQVGGRRPDIIGRLMTKCFAAAGMSLLMDVGLERENAARQIAEELRRARVKLGKFTWRTVASWRDQLKKVPVPAHFVDAQAAFRGVRAKRWPPDRSAWPASAHAIRAYVRELLTSGVL